MRLRTLFVVVLITTAIHAQHVDWMVDDAVGYELNPAMPEHRVAIGTGGLVSMRTVFVDYVYGTKAYGLVALDARDSETGALNLSCLLDDSVAVSAVAVGDGVAYFAGRFTGDRLGICDGSELASVGSGFTENHFIMAWNLGTGAILWSRNLSVSHHDCEDITSIALDHQGRMWCYLRNFTMAQVVRFDATGATAEVRTIQGIRHLGTLSFDPWGGLYASGSCENGTLTFGGQDFAVSSAEGYNMFVLRFRPDGTAGFAKFARDITFQDPTVAATTDGYAYLAGTNFIATTWGDLAVTEPLWGSSVFITKLDSMGHFQWILGPQQANGPITGDIGRAAGPCLAVGGNGQAYFMGPSRGTVLWGHGISSGSLGITDRCLTIVSVDPMGTPQWSSTSEPTTWSVEPQGISAGGGDGAVYFMAHVADHFRMLEVLAGSDGQQTVVVGRLSLPATTAEAVPWSAAPLVWPIPAQGTVWVESGVGVHKVVDLVDASGRIVRTVNLVQDGTCVNVGDLARGTYFLHTRFGEVTKVLLE